MADLGAGCSWLTQEQVAHDPGASCPWLTQGQVAHGSMGS